MVFRKITIEFVETTPVDLSGYTLVEGFPGVGLVGTIAAKYLVEKLEMKQIGYMHADALMPMIRIHDGMPIHPSRLYVNEQRKLCVLLSEQVIPKEYAHTVAHAVIDFVLNRGIARVVSLSGIGSEGGANVDGPFQVYGIASNEDSRKWLLENKVDLIREGITTGVTALMLLELSEHPVMGISLLGAVKLGADYKASAELLKQVAPIMGVDVDVEPLMKEAKETEKELMKQLDRMQTTQKNMEKNANPQLNMYT